VAAHLEPEILLIDEVLAVGDAGFQKKCLGKMETVAKEGRTVLFVSHNIGAVRSLCDSAIWLDDGEIRENGPTIQVTHDYLKHMLAQINDAPNALNLDAFKRDSGTGNVFRLTRMSFNDGGPVYHGEPLNIRFDYEVRRDVYGVSIGIGFNSVEGTRLVSIDSDLEDRRHDFRAGKKGTITMKLDRLLLQPDRYLIDVGARSGVSGKADLEIFLSCMTLDVLPGARTPGIIIRSGGGIRMPANWRWQ
jgi:lipopolysaccharide transport system ATP-binding protein